MLPILPPAPQRTDPANFSSKADAWVDALTPWTDAANALEQSLQVTATTGTSTTSLPIGTGSKGLTTQTGKVWAVGSWVYIIAASSITNTMQGQITAYNSSTGSLVVNVTNASGSGTFTSWVIGLAVPTSLISSLSGGTAGGIPWQSAVNTTSIIAPGVSRQVLLSGGSGAPVWENFNALSVKSFQLSSQTLVGAGPHLNVGGVSATTANIGSGIIGGPGIVTLPNAGILKIGFMLLVSHTSGTVPTSIKVRGLLNTTASQPEYVFTLSSGSLDDTWVEFNLTNAATNTSGVFVEYVGADATTNSFIALQGLTYTHHRT